jgi:hypothetical protein
MSDIAKCNDIHCPAKEYCYRYTALESKVWQSYGVFNREADADNCDMFWTNGKCRYCNSENGKHKLSCPTQKIQINL